MRRAVVRTAWHRALSRLREAVGEDLCCPSCTVVLSRGIVPRSHEREHVSPRRGA